MDPTIYDYLNRLTIGEITQEQLNASAQNTFVDPKNVDFWAGLITVSRALKESRQFGGLPIPGSSAMTTVTIGDGASGTVKPTGSEIWMVQNVYLDNCVAFLTDGSGMQTIVLGGDTATMTGPFYISNDVYIGFSNASGSEQTPGISYHKVSL